MQNPEKTPNWIPTSFTANSETGGGDSVGSFQSVTTLESNAVDLQSNDQFLDVSQQKSSATNDEKAQKTKSESSSAINVFEEDARSSWSEEPKQTEITEFKETAIDDGYQIRVKDTALEENSQPSAKETAIDENFQNSLKEAAIDDSSLISVREVPDYENSENILKDAAVDDNSQDIVKGIVIDETAQGIAKRSVNNENSQDDIKKTAIGENFQNNTKEAAIDGNTQDSIKEAPAYNNSQNSVKETAIDDNCQSSIKGAVIDNNSQSSIKEAAVDDSSQNIVKKTVYDISQNSLKEPIVDENSQNSLKEPLVDENSQNSIKEPTSKLNSQNYVAKTAVGENSQNSVKETVINKNSPYEFNETIIDESFQNDIKIAVDDASQSIIKETAAVNIFKNGINETPMDIDDNSQTSINRDVSPLKIPCLDEDESKREFPPENLYEYVWPQDSTELYILQEQICDYLNVKSFKRKYPDLVRRSLDIAERRYLLERGIVTEMQCDLGLTALRSEEVLELMSKDYPGHYTEYIKVLRQKEQQSISEKHKEIEATKSDKNKMLDLQKKAMKSAAEYNAHLNQERREERRSCMDLQTFTIHYPAKKSKLKKNNTSKPGKYPVALLPGQYQDYYKEYTSEELKYLPVNTVLYGPLKELTSTKALSDGSQSDSDDSTMSEGSCSSSQGTHDDSSSGSEKPDAANKKMAVPTFPYQPKVKPNALCKTCKTTAEGKVKDGRPEELIHCSDCESSAHPSCIELTADVVVVLKTYPWQCMDCKVCSHCRDPNEEDKMLFCDTCDRGYHTFCVGLKSLPQGKWICRQCGSCSICGVNKPGSELSKAQWMQDTNNKVNENEMKNVQPKLLCLSCFKKKR